MRFQTPQGGSSAHVPRVVRDHDLSSKVQSLRLTTVRTTIFGLIRFPKTFGDVDWQQCTPVTCGALIPQHWRAPLTLLCPLWGKMAAVTPVPGS